MTKRHTDRDYEEELTELRERILRMAGRVEAMIANAVRAFIDQDRELAEATIEEDHKVNVDEIEADDLCLRILAKRQPLASDLRFVTLTLKMVTDLERIADQAVNICARAMWFAEEGAVELDPDMPRLAEVVQSQVREAINAFVDRDPDRALQVIASDDEADELYHTIRHRIVDRMIADPTFVPAGLRMQTAAKYLERIADHATNLAEQVVFMVKGKDIRHLGKRWQ